MAADNDLSTNGTEFWLYGYGSLIWKPPPHFDRRIPGWVTGYVRRFWQVMNESHPGQALAVFPVLSSLLQDDLTCSRPISQDHRGTPEAPGRVATLIERSYWEQLTDHHDSAPDRVWGVAYRIKSDKVAEVKDYLDIREINGYTIHYAPFYPADGSEPIRTLVYIGTPDNDQFVGPQDPQALAEHIYKSRGPSGLNIDYLLGLEEALDALSPESGDLHITDLSNRVRAIMASGQEAAPATASSQPAIPAPPPASAVNGHFKQETSVKEQEETEKTF